MKCPVCPATLNRLTGRDGWQVVLTYHAGRIVERRELATVYACPRCEHVRAGRENREP